MIPIDFTNVSLIGENACTALSKSISMTFNELKHYNKSIDISIMLLVIDAALTLLLLYLYSKKKKKEDIQNGNRIS